MEAAEFQRLKRDHDKLKEENAEISEEVSRLRLKSARLSRERLYLLDRLLKYERVLLHDGDATDSGSDDDGARGAWVTDRRFWADGCLARAPARRAVASAHSGAPSLSSSSTMAGVSGVSGASATAAAALLAPAGEERAHDTLALLEAKSGGPAADAAIASSLFAVPAAVTTCQAIIKGRPCNSKAMASLRFCWHHAPLDPESGFAYCTYVYPKRRGKVCQIPVAVDKEPRLCTYHDGSRKKNKEEKAAASREKRGEEEEVETMKGKKDGEALGKKEGGIKIRLVTGGTGNHLK